MKRKKKALQRKKKELKEQEKEEGKTSKQDKTHNYTQNHKVSNSGSVFNSKGKSGLRRTP